MHNGICTVLWSNRHRSFNSARGNKAFWPNDHLKRDAAANTLIFYGDSGIWWRLLHNTADLAQWMIRRHHRFRVHVAAQVTSLMIPPAHPTTSLCVPALVTGNQIDGGFYKGFFRSLLEVAGGFALPVPLSELP